MKFSRVFASAIAGAVLLAACGGGTESSDTTKPNRNVSIPLPGPATVALFAGHDGVGTFSVSSMPLSTSGTTATTLFTDTGGRVTGITGIVYDSQNRIMYWATQESSDLKIRSRNLDSGTTTTLYSIANAFPYGIGLDTSSNQLVWSGIENSTGKIWLGSVDGSAMSTLVPTYDIKGFTVSANKIHGLIGTSVRTIQISPFLRRTLTAGIGTDATSVIADEVNTRTYFANGYGSSPQIYIFPSEGPDAPSVYVTPFRSVMSLALRSDGSLVWADGQTPVGAPPATTSGINLVDPLDPMTSRVFYPTPSTTMTALWLVEQPSTDVDAAVDGNGYVGSEHTCVDASWSSDLPAQRLSRSPEVGREFAWYLDGEVVEGATDREFVPSSSGSLKCVVTASNIAGSTNSESLEVAVADAPSTTSTSIAATTVPGSSETDGGSLSGGGASPVVTSPTTTVAPRYRSISVKWSYNSSKKLLTGTFKKVSGARTYSMTMTGATKKTVKFTTSGSKVTCKATLKKGVNAITVNAKNASKAIVAQKKASKTVR
ncbi:MAG: hypothetical protein RLZ67_1143 [Actinomycetota bacterium]